MDDLHRIDPAVMGVIRVHMRHESRLVRKHGGLAAFVPSYRTYTREDLALLMATARANGGILPIAIRAALMTREEKNVGPKSRPSSLGTTQVDDTKSTKNRRKRWRRKYAK